MGLIPPLNGLRLFEAAARCGSFKLAAQELNLTPGAVSHGINALEKWLGIELFDRKHAFALNAAGRDFFPYVAEGPVDDREGNERSISCQSEEAGSGGVKDLPRSRAKKRSTGPDRKNEFFSQARTFI
jgi:hypothetical protein